MQILMDLWCWFGEILRKYPELAIFLALTIGYKIGGYKIKSFSLGAVTGTLLAGVVIGQIGGIEISGQIKSIFFLLFLFAVGYGIGPQFVRGVSKDGVPQALFAVVICLLCLTCVYVIAKIAGYDMGTSVGLLAGTQTISASMGLATDAMNQFQHSADDMAVFNQNMPVSYAITYLFGTIGTGWIITFLGPVLLRINLKEECARYEREMEKGGSADYWGQYTVRAFKIKDPDFIVGKTVKDAEAKSETRLFIENIRRDGKIISFDDNTVLNAGDIVAVSGNQDDLVYWTNKAEEVADKELVNIPTESVDLLITQKIAAGKTLLELSKNTESRGVYVQDIRRGAVSVNIPVKAQTVIYRGDLLSICGSQKRVAAAIKAYGFADRQVDATNVVFMAGAIFIGGLLGAISIPVNGIPITLSTAGGVLISGILFSWLRSFKPNLGFIPSQTIWFMNSLGLNVFIAVVGIMAGPQFVDGVREAGFSMVGWGVLATGIPMVLAPLIGKYIFRFDPAINLGCCGGSRTSTASVAMVGEAADSNVPMLGYTVPYAVANTLLTLWGLVIVILLH